MNRAIAILAVAALSFSGRAATNDLIQISGQLKITGNITLTVSLGPPPITSLGLCTWSSRFGGTVINVDGASPTCIREGSDGSVVAVGNFTGTVNLGGGNVTSAGSSDIFVIKYNSSGTYQWSTHFGEISTDKCQGVAIDSGGNIIIVGSFTGTINMGGTNLVSAGSTDIYVTKLNSSGTVIMAKRFGGTAGEACNGIALDSSDNILITGNYGFFGTAINFGGGALPLSAGTTAFQFDLFIAKLDSGGNYVWANGYGGLGSDQGNGIALDSNGNPVIAGSFQQTLSVGGGNLVSAGGYDIYAAKYSGSSGAYQWSVRGGGGSDDQCRAVAVDANGFVMITGEFMGTAAIGGSILTSPYNSGLPAMFLTRYSSFGSSVWSQSFIPVASFGSASGYGVSTDSSRNIVLTGYVQGSVGFGNLLLGSGSTDIVIAKFSDIGTLQWAKAYGTLINDSGTSVSVGASDNILATGYFATTANFGCGVLTSVCQADGFVVKLTP